MATAVAFFFFLCFFFAGALRSIPSCARPWVAAVVAAEASPAAVSMSAPTTAATARDRSLGTVVLPLGRLGPIGWRERLTGLRTSPPNGLPSSRASGGGLPRERADG